MQFWGGLSTVRRNSRKNERKRKTYGHKMQLCIYRFDLNLNIYGCQSCPRMTICVVNQLKNDRDCKWAKCGAGEL